VTVTGPAPLPWDVAAIADAALDVLRLDQTDTDADRVTAAAVQATALIDAHIDADVAPWDDPADVPAPVTGAAVNLTVELYRRKDAPFGVADSWSTDGFPVHLSPDTLKGVASMLAPYVERRGVA
jgi:hypothetical protein